MMKPVPKNLNNVVKHLQKSRTSRKIILILGVIVLFRIFILITAYGTQSTQWHVSTENFPSLRHRKSRPSIGKVTMLYGEPHPTYQRALQSHKFHNEIHNYPMFVLREKLVRGENKSKLPYVLSIVIQELGKSPEKRLKWLFWFDGHTIITNSNIPIEIFLPPETDTKPELSDIRLLIPKGPKGLHTGTFLIQVHEWSVKFLAALISLESFESKHNIQKSEEKAILRLLKRATNFADNTLYMPQRWFDAMAPLELIDQEQKNHTTPEKGFGRGMKEIFGNNEHKTGDLLCHFGPKTKSRPKRMRHWLDLRDQHLTALEQPLQETSYLKEIKAFWKDVAPKQVEAKAKKQKAEHEAADQVEEEEREKKGNETQEKDTDQKTEHK